MFPANPVNCYFPWAAKLVNSWFSSFSLRKALNGIQQNQQTTGLAGSKSSTFLDELAAKLGSCYFSLVAKVANGWTCSVPLSKTSKRLCKSREQLDWLAAKAALSWMSWQQNQESQQNEQGATSGTRHPPPP